MNHPKIQTLWLSANPHFQRFAKPLNSYLAERISIAEWQYYQSQDEPCSLEIALILLHDYLKYLNRPIHLIGHSTGGALGLLYARKYPERVKSLTILGVGVNPAIDWQAHYFALREILPCGRGMILAQMVNNLFGYRVRERMKDLINVLEKDLDSSPSPHSLYERVSIPSGGVSTPLLVCGSQDDAIVDCNSIRGWQTYLKKEDRIWEIAEGRHFFHYFFPQKVGDEIINFWQSLAEKQDSKECTICDRSGTTT